MMQLIKIITGDFVLIKKRLTLAVLVIIAVTAARYLPGCGQGLNILTDNPTSVQSDPWADYSYRRGITVNNAGLSTLTDYQVNVLLDTTNFDFSKADVNGSDIRFSVNNTPLSFWIENWNSGIDASIWVKVPSLPSGDTVVYIYYGNAGQVSGSDFDGTFTKDPGFPGLAALWHMDEGTGTSAGDSSPNGSTGTFSGVTWVSPAADGGGWYNRSNVGFSTGESVQTNANTDYILVPDQDSLDPQKITILLWFRANSVTAGHLVSKGNTVDSNLGYALFLNSGRVTFYTSSDGVSFNPLSSDGSVVSAGQWYHVAAVFDGSVPVQRIYINGAPRGEFVPAVSSLINSNSDLVICNQKAGSSNYFNGIIDEVSIYGDALTPAMIEAHSKRSKYSPDVSVTGYGAEETVP